MSIRRKEQAGFSGAPRFRRFSTTTNMDTFFVFVSSKKKKRRSKNFRVTTPKSGTTCICWTKGWLQQIFAQETLSASWRSFAIFGVDVNWIPSPSKQFLECLDINDVSGGWLWKSSLYILQYHNGWGIIPKEFINMSISILFSIHVKSYLSSFGIFPTELVLNIELHILFQKTKWSIAKGKMSDKFAQCKCL